MYFLGHKELQIAATGYLGELRIKGYQERLHTWADDYRQRGWPAGTPEYLLRGYFSMLYAATDVPRLMACATDQARHDRMLHVTGSDTAALTKSPTPKTSFYTSPTPTYWPSPGWPSTGPASWNEKPTSPLPCLRRGPWLATPNAQRR